jgi:hypothetical protein
MTGQRAPTHPIEPYELYSAARSMSSASRRALGMIVPVTIYVQDPLVALKHSKLGLKKLELDWEPGLMDGPTTARIAVVDYNADTGELAEPARWDREAWCFLDSNGQPVDEDNHKNPQFRQVNVWAIMQNILGFYEDARVLGRAIPWGFEGNRLIAVPHAGYRMNAFYHRNSKSLQFYYFGAPQPQDAVHTCLSHDIIAHETGHAILDGIRPYYNELNSLQTAAFHEFLADLTAILSALRNNDVRHVVADLSGGDLWKESVIGDLAEMFGQDMAQREHGAAARPYLRTAHNELTMSDIKEDWTAHDCSQILTGAMFEILSEMTLHHMQQGESAKMALWHATDRLTRIALRPLDLCPPADIQFVDYARAVLHADHLAYPEDSLGYRGIIRKVFHKRGFCSRSETDDDHDPCDLTAGDQLYNVHFRRYDIARVSNSRTMAYHFLHENRELLGIPDNQDFYVVDLYDTDKVVEAERRLPREIIIEYLWREDILLKGGRFARLEGEKIQLLCGGTLVFDGRGNILSFCKKPGVESSRDGADRQEGQRRRGRLLDYVASLVRMERLGMAGDRGIQGLDTSAPPVIAHHVDGALRLEVVSHLRH